MPIPLGSGVFGSLIFYSREPESYIEEDLGFARRVAHHLALALSYKQLAEAARRSTEAREMAARLEAQVATLTAEQIALVEGELGFKGRVARDNWLQQAEVLARGGVEEYRKVFGKDPR